MNDTRLDLEFIPDDEGDPPKDSLTIDELRAIRQKLCDLEANGTYMDDFPFVPDWECAFRAWLVRTFADSEVDPDIAIRNLEKYRKYITEGFAEPEKKSRQHLKPVETA